MALPTLFFHQARRYRELQRQHAGQPLAERIRVASAIAHELDRAIESLGADPTPEETTLLTAVRQAALVAAVRCYRIAERAYLARQDSLTLGTVARVADEVDKAIAAVQQHAIQEQCDDARRRGQIVAEPMPSLFGKAS